MATCTHSIQEAKALCSMAIRDADAWELLGWLTPWRHPKSIQHLEEQAIQEEGKSQLDFLFACQAAIQPSPVELSGALVASYHVLMRQEPMFHPFTLSQGASPTEQAPAPMAPSSQAPEHSPCPKW